MCVCVCVFVCANFLLDGSVPPLPKKKPKRPPLSGSVAPHHHWCTPAREGLRELCVFSLNTNHAVFYLQEHCLFQKGGVFFFFSFFFFQIQFIIKSSLFVAKLLPPPPQSAPCHSSTKDRTQRGSRPGPCPPSRKRIKNRRSRPSKYQYPA